MFDIYKLISKLNLYMGITQQNLYLMNLPFCQFKKSYVLTSLYLFIMGNRKFFPNGTASLEPVLGIVHFYYGIMKLVN
jgi:hypothetical protein